ncbi:MAG: response regulator [Candidatus Rokubacteria bacterium]|nr:response regulator [Candidatus Rokubacteria bacterium]
MSTTAGTKKLLVIDDDAKVTALFVDFFGDRYDVETAHSGLEGLSSLERRRPDLVLLDINMPGKNGLEVLKDIKRLDGRIPVIMVTANNEISAAEEALKGGAFAYLPKPFQLQYAAHLVAAALDEARGRR